MYNKDQYVFATSKNLQQTCNNLFKGNHWFNISLLILSALYFIIYGYDGLVLALNIGSFSFFFYRFVLGVVGLEIMRVIGWLNTQKTCLSIVSYYQ